MSTTNEKRGLIRSLVFALSVLACASVEAHWHGGGGGWHGGGWHDGGWHGGGWYPVNVTPCQTIYVCNRYGGCWWERSCY